MESGFKTESIWLQRPKFSLLQVPKGLYTIPSALEFLESLNLYLQSAVRIVGSELYVLISLASDDFLFPSKIFPFFFLPFFSLSSYFGLQWYLTRYSSTSICLSSSLSHTHILSQSLVYISSLTLSPDLKLLRAVFMPSHITWNQQRALDYLKWWRFILKTLQVKRERAPRKWGGSAAQGQASQRPGTLTPQDPLRQPWCPPCCTRLSGQGLFSTLVSLWLFLLHVWILASLSCCLCFCFFLLSAFLSVLT